MKSRRQNLRHASPLGCGKCLQQHTKYCLSRSCGDGQPPLVVLFSMQDGYNSKFKNRMKRAWITESMKAMAVCWSRLEYILRLSMAHFNPRCSPIPAPLAVYKLLGWGNEFNGSQTGREWLSVEEHVPVWIQSERKKYVQSKQRTKR